MIDVCENCLECNQNEVYGSKVYCEYHRIYVYPGESGCSHFRSRDTTSSSCYITTIIHDILKKDDHCEVMETLRNFRDHFLQKNEEYASLLFEYDTIGPKIAECLAIDEDREFCQILYDHSLRKISNMILNKEYQNAISCYRGLTRELQEYYHIEKNNEDISYYDFENGGHGKVFFKNL